ncbi:hypothetical protein [Novosphingobium aquae]|uniref:Uncharacterized protein n=1 Tax=Novosphingobium aquae TaxID=3133435 RepID=A0ABU8SCE5_9SPHN
MGPIANNPHGGLLAEAAGRQTERLKASAAYRGGSGDDDDVSSDKDGPSGIQRMTAHP